MDHGLLQVIINDCLIAVGVGDVVECAASLIQLVAKKKGTVRIKLTHLLIFSIV
jgi:hypothetical protein